MIRTQIQLTDEQDRRLAALSNVRRVSKAELVRQAIDLLLQQQVPPATMHERWERAKGIAGAFDSGLGDVAEHHDAYLAEAYRDQLNATAPTR